MKKALKILISRPAIITLLLLLQIAVLSIVVLRFSNQYVYVTALLRLIAVLVVLRILHGWTNPAYKLSWISLILLSPIFGLLLYVLFGNRKLGKRAREKMSFFSSRAAKTFFRKSTAQPYIEQVDPVGAVQSGYLEKYAGYPLFRGTQTKYYPSGESFYNDFLLDLAQAKNFIFMEYFILSNGEMWDGIFQILKERCACGVDIRIIYDDFGSLLTLPNFMRREMQKAGIQIKVFNPIIPILNSGLNNRDHRKICIIDGNIGYTGGINIADEYINRIRRFGYWKDSAVRLYGEGVWGFTAMFLTMWSYLTGNRSQLDRFRPTVRCSDANGFVHPYPASPLDDENIAENTYLNLITRASKYLYIMTPYLIPDNEIRTALCNAAKCGVDVRIVTPGIPDKKYVFTITRANYEPLLSAGVRIYEFTPGFVHAKNFLCDDQYGIVGTINMDFRSLYLHFECAAFMCQTDALNEMKSDFTDTFRRSKEITLDNLPRSRGIRRLWQDILNAFSPLM